LRTGSLTVVAPRRWLRAAVTAPIVAAARIAPALVASLLAAIASTLATRPRLACQIAAPRFAVRRQRARGRRGCDRLLRGCAEPGEYAA